MYPFCVFAAASCADVLASKNSSLFSSMSATVISVRPDILDRMAAGASSWMANLEQGECQSATSHNVESGQNKHRNSP